MSDMTAILHVDAVLGRGIEVGHLDPTAQAAQTLVRLDDGDRGIPSGEFRQRLKSELFPSPAPAMTETITPSDPVPVYPSRERGREHRMSANRLLAIAATFVLLLGGAGIILEGPLRSPRTPEPSAIPAVSFASPATSESTPQASQLPIWTADAPEGAGIEYDPSHQIAGGRIFRAFEAGYGTATIQAIDAATGAVLWERPDTENTTILSASGDVLVVAAIVSGSPEPDQSFRLVGLDAQTGRQLWQRFIAATPVGAVATGDRVLVLDWSNTLTSIGLNNGEHIYTADVGGDSPSGDALPVQPGNFRISPGRMVIIGTTVAVVLADGSVAAINGETGRGLWWSYRALQGATSLHAVGDRLLIASDGSFILPPADTPLLPIRATPSPEAGDCATSISTDLAGTNISKLTPPDYVGAIYGVDIASGTIAWSGTTALYLGPLSHGTRTSSDFLFLDTSSYDRGVTIRGEWCAIDVATGTVAPVTYSASVALGSFVNNVGGRILETVAVFDNGEFVAYPTTGTIDPATTVVDLSPYLANAAYWIELYDGAFYISMGDGTLMKVDGR